MKGYHDKSQENYETMQDMLSVIKKIMSNDISGNGSKMWQLTRKSKGSVCCDKKNDMPDVN